MNESTSDTSSIKYTPEQRLEIIATVTEKLQLKRDAENGKADSDYLDYYNRFVAGEVSPQELRDFDGDWLIALKTKDRVKKNDIIDGPGQQARRNEIACLNQRPFTDLGNSERLIDQYKTVIRYCHPFKSYYIWNPLDGRWKKDSNDHISRIAVDVVRRIPIEAQRSPTQDKMKEGYKWAFVCETRAHINGMVDLAQSNKNIIIEPDELDSDDYLFNLRNCTFNLKTVEMQSHTKSDNISKLADFDYNPNATCPMWLKYLERIFRNRGDKKEETISFLQRAVGYTLSGGTQEQCLFLLHGSGANGKSVFLDVLNALMGEYGAVTQSSSFTTNHGDINNDIAALAGMRLVCSSENSSETKLDEALIKQLTGGEKISARFLHQEYFTFRPKFKIWWAFNHAPAITDMTNSIWRRIKIIPFEEVLPESEWDKNLASKLISNEISGIFNWAVEGLRKYNEIGLNPPEAVTKATSDYRLDQDVLNDFVVQYCEIPQDNEGFGKSKQIKASDLYTAYKQWNSLNGDDKVMSSTKFGRLLKDKGFAKVHNRDGAHYIGIRLQSGKFAR